MKKFIKLLCILLVAVEVLLNSAAFAVSELSPIIHKNEIVTGTEGEGAILEEQLEMPEKGWKRYDDTSEFIQYTGSYKQLSDSEYYDNTLSLCWGKGSKVHFNVDGSKMRILLGTVPEKFKVVDYPYELVKTNIYIDGKVIDTMFSVSSRLNYTKGSIIKYEYDFDKAGKHDVVFEMNSDTDEIHLDAVDVIGKLINKSVNTDADGNVISTLHRYYNSNTGTYLYDFRDEASLGDGYIKDDTTCTAYLNKTNYTIPVYEYYRAKDNKYFYTMDKSVIGNDKHYQYLGAKFYIDKDNAQKMVITQKPLLGRILELYRYCRNFDQEHFYTTNWNEVGSGNAVYNYEGVECRIFECQEDDTIPLYRYCRNDGGIHFYTTNPNELGAGNPGYTSEGIVGYVYSFEAKGTVKLYRYYQKSIGGHFYTTNFNELGNGNDAYASENIACYVLPR
ncbi:MAG: hypothetical protein E7214_03525 [Clostridium sp.]|nr:hypothetical protein [Clostridium sp.]